jgi:hypothetical protein
MLSHAKTEMDVVNLLDDMTFELVLEPPLLEIIQQAQKMGFKLILTTDHGTINVKNPSKVVGDKTPASICATKQVAA